MSVSSGSGRAEPAVGLFPELPERLSGAVQRGRYWFPPLHAGSRSVVISGSRHTCFFKEFDRGASFWNVGKQHWNQLRPLYPPQ
jgi:hypothetical protein